MAGYKRVNFYELCRLCATNQQKDKTHIFQEEGRKIQLQTKIQSCLSLNVCENDFLPKVVCSKCLRTLEVYYSFRQECVTSESMLSSYFKNFRCTEDFKKSGKVYIKDTTTKFSTSQYQEITSTSPNTSNTNTFTTVNDIKPVDVPFYTLQLPTIVTNQPQVKAEKIVNPAQVQNQNYVNTINLAAVKTIPKISNESLSNVVVNANGEVLNIAQLVDIESIINQASLQKIKPKVKNKEEAIIKIDLTTNEEPVSCDTGQAIKEKPQKKYSYSLKVDEKLNPAVVFNNLQEFNQTSFNGNYNNNLYSQSANIVSVPNIVESTVNLNVLNQDLNSQSFTRSFPQQPKLPATNAELLDGQMLKTHVCDICQKSFKRREHLYQHVKLHTGFRPYTCENCNKSFMRKEHLLRHMTSHSGQKNFTCSICEKSFSRNDNLLKHKKTHEKQASYTCEVCQKQFVMKHYYLAHKRVHDTNDCDRCGLGTVWGALKT